MLALLVQGRRLGLQLPGSGRAARRSERLRTQVQLRSVVLRANVQELPRLRRPRDTPAVSVVVITGPPCSGKSTYVRTHAQPGDIVIDFDAMAQAFGSPTPHDHSSAVRHVTIMARRAAIAAALTVHHQTPVWIVDCTISPERLAQYTQHGARMVRLTVDTAELHRRASAQRPRLWHRLIDQWQPPQGVEDTSGSRAW